jgi:hypothetical protein
MTVPLFTSLFLSSSFPALTRVVALHTHTHTHTTSTPNNTLFIRLLRFRASFACSPPPFLFFLIVLPRTSAPLHTCVTMSTTTHPCSDIAYARIAGTHANDDAVRRERTLFVKGIPLGLPPRLIYFLLFNEPPTLDRAARVNRYAHLYDRMNGGLSSYALTGDLRVRPWRRHLLRVRINTPPQNRGVYGTAFIEFATRTAALHAQRALERVDATAWGGKPLHVEEARQPIRDSKYADFDPVTGRPCLYGLHDDDSAVLQRHYSLC